MFPLILAAAALAPVAAGHAERVAEAVVGRWVTETRHGIVEITPCGGSICGRLVDSDSIRANPQKRDEHNKDPARRQRLLKGLTMLQGFTGHASRWDGGSVYNPDDGGTYHGTLTVEDAKPLKCGAASCGPCARARPGSASDKPARAPK